MISEELILDASDADRTISQIDEQLQQAAELFKVALADALAILSQPIIAPVEADTTAAATSIAALADAAPVDVPVAADTGEAEQLILALGDQPPVDVPVDADTSAAVESISELAQSVPPIDIPVEAETAEANAQIADLGAASSDASSSVDGLQGSVTGLGAAAGIAGGSAKELVGAIGEMGGEGGKAAAGGILAVTGATAGFFEAGLDAVSAGQRFTMILGDMAEKITAIDVNGLHTSMEELGIQFGSTGAEMENVNSKLYQNAINAGVSSDKAILFTQQIETLAARAISLNPQLGTLDEVSSSLGDKLARGGRFAQNFGIQLTASEIALRAESDTGKTTAADLTVLEKSMAGAELASEKYGDTLAGTVAKGSQNAVVQLESLKATFKEAIEQIGVPLVAPVFELIKQAEPDAVLIAQDLATLGKDALPAVSGALAALDPPLRLLSDVLDAIPTPIIAGTIAFLGMNAAIGALAATAPEAVGAILAVESTFPPLAIAAGLAVAAMSLFGGGSDDTKQHVDDLTQALTDQDGVLRITTEDLANYINKSSDIGKDPQLVDALNRANISFQDLSTFAEQGSSGVDALAKRLVGSGGLREAMALNGAEVRDSTGAIHQNSETVEVAGQRYLVLDGKARTLIDKFKELQKAAQDSAEQNIASSVAAGKLTQADVDAAESKHHLNDGTIDEIGVLNDLAPKLGTTAAATTDLGTSSAQAAVDTQKLAITMAGIASSAPDVTAALEGVRSNLGDQFTSLEQLAVAVDKANLSQEQMDAVAKTLGVSTNALSGFIKDVTGQLDGFVSAAMKGLPGVGDAIDAALDPKKHEDKPIIIDPDKLQAELDDAIAKIDAFNINLAFLTQHGFDNLAKAAAEKGPEFTAALVQSIQKGGDDLGASLDGKFAELNNKVAGEPDQLRTFGAGIAVATGQIAADASSNFGDMFNLTAPTQQQLDSAKFIARNEQIPFKEALREVAGDAAVAYEERLAGLPVTTATALTESGTAIDGGAKGLADSATGAGASAAGGFAAGMGPIPANADQIITSAGGAISNAAFTLRAIASTEGFFIGYDFTLGLASGIGDSGAVAAVISAARSAVQSGVNEARRQAGISSPSKVMAKLGEQMVAGLAMGLGDTSDLEAASRNLVAIATPSLGIINGPGGTPGISSVASGSAAGLSGAVISIAEVSIHLDAAASTNPAVAAQAGSAAADAFQQRVGPLAARSVVVAGTL